MHSRQPPRNRMNASIKSDIAATIQLSIDTDEQMTVQASNSDNSITEIFESIEEALPDNTDYWDFEPGDDGSFVIELTGGEDFRVLIK